MQSKTFRLFISSTFSDFNEERRLLQTYVFPEIKRYCSELNKGYTFQPIDLRWGVSNEAQLDQKTLELCINEVHASKLQPHPNFLIMAGDRYGWVPCPYVIEAGEYNTILSKVTSKEDQALLDKWYQLDNNQIPASYVLQERSGAYEDYDTWAKDEEQLREILQTAVELANLDATSKEKYFDSATEQEVLNGIIKYKDKTPFQVDQLINNNEAYESLDESHVYGYIRNITTVEGAKPEADTEFFDKENLQPRIDDFKQQLRDSIKGGNTAAGNLLEVNADLVNFNKDKANKSLIYEYKAIGTKSDKDSEEGSEFVQSMIACLRQSIEKFDKDIKSISLDSLQAIEIDSQSAFKDDKAKGFIGREDDLQAIQDYIEDNHQKADNNQALVIYGPSGMGKSALMAKAIEQTEAKHQDKQKILYRFVASTASLSTSVEVITSILKETGTIDNELLKIQIIQGEDRQDKPEDLDQFFARLSGYLSNLTEPTTIFIDAVDQFTDKDALIDKHEFIWLPSQLPENLKIVISALEDDKYKEDSMYLELLKTRIDNQDNLHKLEPFNDKHAEEMIDGILGLYKRSITPDQQSYLFEQPDSKQPLYLSIAAQELKHWKSTDTTKAYQAQGQGQDLAPTQREIIDEYLQNLTELYHHDQELVHRVVSYLHLSDGLSESELIEILSTDTDFIQTIAPDTFHTNINQELPVSIWARLHTQLKPFLKLENKDGQETMGFFHREFDSVIAEQEDIEQTHENLIKLVLELMHKYQNQVFDSNRYGKLYIELIAERFRLCDLRLAVDLSNTSIQRKNKWTVGVVPPVVQDDHHRYKKVLETYSVDVVTIENHKYLKGLVLYVSKIGKIKLDDWVYESFIYYSINLFLTNSLYQKNPNDWEGCYGDSKYELAAAYNELYDNPWKQLANNLYNQSLKIREKLYKKDPDFWLKDYIQSLDGLALNYYYLKSCENSIVFFEKALKIREKHYLDLDNVSSLDYFHNIENIARSHQCNNQIDRAVNFQNRSVNERENFYENILEEDFYLVEDYFNSLSTLASYCYQKGQTKKSINLTKKVLRLTEKLYKKDRDIWAVNYYYALDSLAITYRNNKQIEQAIDLEKKCLILTEDFYQKQPHAWWRLYYESLDKISKSKINKGQIQEGVIFYERKALKIIKELNKKSYIFWQTNYFWWAQYSNIVDNLTKYYQRNKQPEKAIDFFAKFLESVEGYYNKSPDFWWKKYTNTINDLAKFYEENNQSKKAFNLYKKELKIIEYHCMDYSFMTSMGYTTLEYYFEKIDNICRYFDKNNRFQEINDTRNKSLEIIEKLYKVNDLDEANLIPYQKGIKNLVEFYKDAGQITKIVKIYENYPSRWADLSCRHIKYYLVVLDKIFKDFLDNNQLKKAINFQVKTLEIIESLYQENPSIWAEHYAKVLGALSVSYHNDSQIEQALAFEKKSLAVAEDLYKENPNVWANYYIKSLNNYAITLKKNNQINEGTTVKEKALAITRVMYQENPSDWAETYIQKLGGFSNFYADNNQIKKAIELGEKALEVADSLYQENASSWVKIYIATLINMSELHSMNNEIDQAIIFEKKASKILESLYQDNPKVWGEYYKYLDGLKESNKE